MTAEEIIALLNLEPLPFEGGFYRQTYKAKGYIPVEALPLHPSARAFGTAIYYLVTQESFSALHRVPQDEMFHFYLGDPVEMLQLQDGGEAKRLVIGQDLVGGQRPQALAPGNVWQGTRLLPGGKWALLGCTVCPGFEFEDFQMLSREELVQRFPQHRDLILRFTPDRFSVQR